jgi:hypothetical protein
MNEVRFQNEEMSDFKNAKKEVGKEACSNTTDWKRTKSVGTLVRLLWRAAASGLKPLHLPRAHPLHLRVNKTK